MGMTPSRRQIEILTIADIAIDGRVFVVRCNLCRRTTYFLASDLATYYGDKFLVKDLFQRCSKCGKFEYINVSHRLTHMDDEGALTIRRPKRVWRWANETYRKEEKTPEVPKRR